MDSDVERIVKDLCLYHQSNLYNSPEWEAAGKPALTVCLEAEHSSTHAFPQLPPPITRETRHKRLAYGVVQSSFSLLDC